MIGIALLLRVAPALLGALASAPVLGAHADGALLAEPDAPSAAVYALALDAGERVTQNLWFSIRPDDVTSSPPVVMLRLRIVAPDGHESSSPLCITARIEERRFGVVKSCAPFRFTAGPAGRYAFFVEDRTLIRRSVDWWLLSRKDFPKEGEEAP